MGMFRGRKRYGFTVRCVRVGPLVWIEFPGVTADGAKRQIRTSTENAVYVLLKPSAGRRAACKNNSFLMTRRAERPKLDSWQIAANGSPLSLALFVHPG